VFVEVLLDGSLDHVGGNMEKFVVQGEEIDQRLVFKLRENAGTSWTRNQQFDDDGYLIQKNFYEIDSLVEHPGELRGVVNYGKTVDDYWIGPSNQVEGSLSRYSYPGKGYKEAHTAIRFKVEKIIGRKLYNTYYFDRFYFPGQDLAKHCDRISCEISVSLNVSTSLKGKDSEWPFWIRTPFKYAPEDKKKRNLLDDGEDRCAFLSSGDAVIYKGCECLHWRDAMPGIEGNEEQFYHQIFFHYVLADGRNVHAAGDQLIV